MKLENLKKRFKNPVFRLALVGFVYQILKACGIEIDHNLYQTGCDILSYILIGAGVYSTFPEKPKQLPKV